MCVIRLEIIIEEVKMQYRNAAMGYKRKDAKPQSRSNDDYFYNCSNLVTKENLNVKYGLQWVVNVLKK